MAKKNFTISTVATAPSPATSGTSLVVASGDGSLFAVNEPAIIFPVNDQPLVANAEIVMVTNVATDTLTITREQESTSARTIVVGDIIIQGITAKDWNDLLDSIPTDVGDLGDSGSIYVPSTDRSGDGDSVATVNSSEIEGEYLVKFDADGNIADSGIHSGDVLPYIDEDDMSSNLDTKVPTQQSVKAYVDTVLQGMYPVGSIYINATSSTNPATLFGFGTWVAFGAGRVMVGIDTSDTSFDTAEETGGAKTHTLTSAEMPSHTHTQDSHNHTQNSHNHTQNAHSHTTRDDWSFKIGTGTTNAATGSSSDPRGNATSSTTATNIATTATNQATTATNQNTGGGGAHNNLQPYIVVYMWKRTA